MAIKDRHGNVYTLRGPNPLMSNQSEWDYSKVKLINLKYKSEAIKDISLNVVKVKLATEAPRKTEVKKLVEVPKVIPAKQFIEDINEESETISVDPHISNIMKERSVEYYCAPVTGYKTHQDDFYDNSYKTPVYGEAYIFDAIMIDEGDLQLQFWCIKPITKNSIVYRKVQDGGERWWRISQIENKSGGYLVIAVTSDINPRFQ